MRYGADSNDRGQSLAGNPLVASVLRENVRLADGRATIGLWGNWAALLSGIPAFGKVLAITRNSQAVLGRISGYPEVASVPCGQCGRAVDGSLDFDFTSWQRAVAIVEARPGGWLYSIEFSDFSGDVIHKICLTKQSDFETFRSWIELNQTASGGPLEHTSTRHGAWLENTVVLSASGAEPLRNDALRVFVQMATAERWAFRAIVGNAGAVQAAQVTPTAFSRNGQWFFAGDETSGVHVRVEKLGELFLHEVGEFLLLKGCDPEGRFVCAITPPDDGDRGSWNARLCALAEDFPTSQ
ncbi:MAG: ChuX/HutX family heme-like substrate-binding protein [Terrimicrobiaceae bacterium]